METVLMGLVTLGGACAVIFVAHGLALAQGRLNMVRSLRRRDRR